MGKTAARGIPARVSPSTTFGTPAILAIPLPRRTIVTIPVRSLPLQLTRFDALPAEIVFIVSFCYQETSQYGDL
jgi:hypothetical protein